MATAYLAEQGRTATRRLLRVSRDDFDMLFDEMVDLPVHDVSMQLRLPRLMTPELGALAAAIDDDNEESAEALMDAALTQVDDPERRAQLAKAVLALADVGRVDAHVAAVAVIDLSCDDSALVRSSLVEALAVSVGATKTPAGLLVASG